MRDPFLERLNKEKYRKTKWNNMHNLADCFQEEMSDEEIAQEMNISLEEVRKWREKYEG
ncbi:MAG TPA: hypothetical protein GX697_05635 [Firmicutes bacterium]|nr:hypothetical protein [Bacillota bacterium]